MDEDEDAVDWGYDEEEEEEAVPSVAAHSKVESILDDELDDEPAAPAVVATTAAAVVPAPVEPAPRPSVEDTSNASSQPPQVAPASVPEAELHATPRQPEAQTATSASPPEPETIEEPTPTKPSNPAAPPPPASSRPVVPTVPRTDREPNALSCEPSGPASTREVAPEPQAAAWETRRERESGTQYWHDEQSGRTSWSAPDGSTPAVASSAQGHEILPATGQRLPSNSRPSFTAPVESPPPVPMQETERERLRRIGREKEAERELNKHVLNRPLSRTTASRPARTRPSPGDAYDPPLPAIHRSRSRSPGRSSASALVSPPPPQQQLSRPPFQPQAPSRKGSASFLGSTYLAARATNVDVNYVAGGVMRKWGAGAGATSGEPPAASSAPVARLADTPEPQDRQQRLDERIALRDRLTAGGRRDLDAHSATKPDTPPGRRELDGRGEHERHALGGGDRIAGTNERERHAPTGGPEPHARDERAPPARQAAGDRANNRELPPHLLAPPPPPPPMRISDRRHGESSRLSEDDRPPKRPRRSLSPPPHFAGPPPSTSRSTSTTSVPGIHPSRLALVPPAARAPPGVHPSRLALVPPAATSVPGIHPSRLALVEPSASRAPVAVAPPAGPTHDPSASSSAPRAGGWGRRVVDAAENVYRGESSSGRGSDAGWGRKGGR